MKKLLGLTLSCAWILSSMTAKAQDAGSGSGISKSKVFLTTSTYGVMAGSLVGLASLTFYKQPGKKLRNVAIGASLGLYTGLLLGAYMIYFVPDPNKPKADPAAAPPPSLDSDDPLNIGGEEAPQGSFKEPSFYPIAFYDGKDVVLGLDYRF